MKKRVKRLMALALSAALALSMTLTAGAAYKFPNAYWKLQDAWVAAQKAQDPDKTIAAAQKTWDLLYKDGPNTEICGNLEFKCGIASWCCEMKGDINGAYLWMNRQEEMARWLTAHGTDRRDVLLNIPARRAYLDAVRSMTIYAQTETDGPVFAGSGAPNAGTLCGSVLNGSRQGESAVLAYIDFLDGYTVDYWVNYFKSTNEKFNKAATQGGVIELAWNFKPESTEGCRRVLSADDYINEGVRALGQLNATVLLRVGAEMNNWVESDPETYKQAFRKIAEAASAYPNLKLVFSPTDIGNRNHSFDEYYPGDGYVDWIGVNTYDNTNYTGQTTAYTYGAQTYGNDAFYGTGVYDSDPLYIIKPMADFAKAHNKPMMIGECGFGYRDNRNGADQTAYAVDQMTKFYSWVNMIYPQVKAVFYFDTELANAPYSYTLANNSQIAQTYDQVIRENGGYLMEGQTRAKTWKPLNQMTAEGQSLRLASYATFPGSASTTVSYFVDGKWAASSSRAPFYFDLDLTSLAPGSHTVKAVASSGKFRNETTSTFTVKGDGSLPLYEADKWARATLIEAEKLGLITDRTGSGFKNKITRLQFAELAVNLIEKATGKAIDPAGQSFSDTNDVMVLKAAAAGVTAGNGSGAFLPGKLITRQEMCVMLNSVVSYVDKANGTATLTNTSTQVDAKFKDVDQIAGWAKNAVALMTNNGVMSGGDGKVLPLNNATIQEAIILIYGLNGKF